MSNDEEEEEEEKKNNVDGKIFSAILDCLPILGNIKGSIELAIGKDLITQEKFDEVDYTLTATSLFLSGASKAFGKMAKNSSKAVKVLKKVNECCDTVNDIKRFNEKDEEDDD